MRALSALEFSAVAKLPATFAPVVLAIMLSMSFRCCGVRGVLPLAVWYCSSAELKSMVDAGLVALAALIIDITSSVLPSRFGVSASFLIIGLVEAVLGSGGLRLALLRVDPFCGRNTGGGWLRGFGLTVDDAVVTGEPGRGLESGAGKSASGLRDRPCV